MNGEPGTRRPPRGGKRRNSLGPSTLEERMEKVPLRRSRSDDATLSSNQTEENGTGVAAQLNFLPNEGKNVDVQYDDVTNALGESWRDH